MSGYVATCAHVVRHALGFGQGVPPEPGTGVGLSCLFAKPAASGGWRPDIDLATLKLEGDPSCQTGWMTDRERC